MTRLPANTESRDAPTSLTENDPRPIDRDQGVVTPKRVALIFATLGALQFGGAVVGLGTLVALAIWALRGPRAALQALTLSWFVAFLTPAVRTSLPAEDAARWFVLGCAGIGVTIHYVRLRRAPPKAVAPLLLFVLVACVLSSYSSTYLDVSLFKLATFAAGGMSILLAFHATKGDREYWNRWFGGLFAVVVLGSVPLYLTPVGFLRNGSGFQGILDHPQAFAVFLAPIVAWLGGRLLVSQRPDTWSLVMFVLCLVSLVSTRSRTAVVASTIAIALSAVLAILIRPRWRSAIVQANLQYRRLALGVLILAATSLAAESLYSASVTFALKGKTDRSIQESFSGSRGFLIERSMSNFARSPWAGIGFGVPSDPADFTVRREPLFGIPVGAAVEKGILPVAVLEEVGVIGAAFASVLVLSLLRPTLRAKSIAPFCLGSAALLVNLGESVFFSMGGMGMYTWLLLGFARIQE